MPRLLVVANRLPVTADRDGDEWALKVSSGGLASAFSGVQHFQIQWIGWPGVSVRDEVGRETLTRALAAEGCIPVFLEDRIVEDFYTGFNNGILWPILHSHHISLYDSTMNWDMKYAAYSLANEMFGEVIGNHYQQGDVVWCQDFHLMLLPKLLKECNKQMKVGWFLHTAFPTYHIFGTFPACVELLQSTLEADLVGFHTNDYAENFVNACTHILGLVATSGGIMFQENITKVATFPIGIDSHKFMEAVKLPEVQDQMKKLKKQYRGKKVVVGVDRLDTIKGIPNKYLAFEKFLQDNPDLCEKVILVQIAVPSRTDVPQYQRLTHQVHEMVGRINGRFGTLAGLPLRHLDCSLDFNALCALYAIADVALITSVQDGMNLVSHEFVACQDEKNGVLVLSQYTGSAQALKGAVLINPSNTMEVAAEIGRALVMPFNERKKRHKDNFQYIATHTAQLWAETFVSELCDGDQKQTRLQGCSSSNTDNE